MGSKLDAMRKAVKQGAKKPAPQMKPRLPDGSHFSANYVCLTPTDGFWNVTLTIGLDGQSFTVRRGGIFAALTALDHQYRRSLKAKGG